MPRGARFVFENAFYHVFNRGINKQVIFKDESDYRFFLKRLKDGKEKYRFSIYAYCLMPNHFHLSIRTRKISVSKIMSSLATSYAMYFNRKYNHFGSVFQNRFKSILIEHDAYFIQLSQYIYLNPLKAGFVTDPILYKFSSIREALGKESLFILDSDIVRIIGETKKSQKEYEKFIYSGLTDDFSEFTQLFDKEEGILGSERFATLAQKKYIRRKTKRKLR